VGDVIAVILGFAVALGIFYLRVKEWGGWPLLPKSKIRTLFDSKDKDDNST
jgi:hypothetical protein